MTASGIGTSPRIIVACVQKNELHRYLPNLIQGWATFADKIVILDDNSDEDQQALLDEALEAVPIETTVVSSEASQALWGNESPLRQQLWHLALRESSEGDWIFILDADMIPANNPREVFNAAEDGNVKSVAFTLYDLWSLIPLRFRSDPFWRGHFSPRVWAVRHGDGDRDRVWKWSERGVHTGHLPENYNEIALVAPKKMALLHLAYATPEDREAKHRQYTDLADQLTPQEYAHAESILDENPNLLPLPFGTDFGRWLCKAGPPGSDVAPREPFQTDLTSWVRD